MTVPGAVPSVREILVESILWWLEGQHWAEPGPGLQMFTPDQRQAMYVLVAAVEREVGQSRLESLIVHLAHHGGAYMTADGQIIEANRRPDTPDLPMSLLDAARALYASASQAA